MLAELCPARSQAAVLPPPPYNTEHRDFDVCFSFKCENFVLSSGTLFDNERRNAIGYLCPSRERGGALVSNRATLGCGLCANWLVLGSISTTSGGRLARSPTLMPPQKNSSTNSKTSKSCKQAKPPLDCSSLTSLLE